MEQDNTSTSGGTQPSQPLHEGESAQEQTQQEASSPSLAASVPQGEQTQKGPAQGWGGANWSSSTKLFLEGQDSASPATYGENTTMIAPPPFSAPGTPTAPGGYPAQVVPVAGMPHRSASNTAVWWVVGIAGALAVILIGLLGASLFIFSSRNNSGLPATQVLSTPGGNVSSSARVSSTSTAVPAATTYLAAIPNHFNVRTDCQVDNGYRCTVVLVASQLMPGSVSWVASSSSLSSKFSPASGVVYPNQQQQVIVYIYNTCPYSGSVVFSTNEGTIAVPVAC